MPKNYSPEVGEMFYYISIIGTGKFVVIEKDRNYYKIRNIADYGPFIISQIIMDGDTIIPADVYESPLFQTLLESDE